MKKGTHKKKLYYTFMIIISFFILSLNVKGEVIGLYDSNSFFGVNINGYSDFPQDWTARPNEYRNLSLTLYNYEGLTRPYKYLVMTACIVGTPQFKIINAANSQSFFNEFFTYVDFHQECVAGDYLGSIYYLQFEVGNYKDMDGTGEELMAQSTLQIKSSMDVSVLDIFYDVGLSSDDVVSSLRILQQNGYKLDNISTSISNQTNTIINNQNSNTNSIINNQNSNQAQTNQRLDDIENMDIGSNEKQMPNQDNFNSYTSNESQLLDSVNQADMSVLDIAIDSDSSNFVWTNLTNFIQSHQLVFSMFISILSIGIIKLSLGR